ncbi:MAG: ATP-dependent helicase [Actinomycetales bacterium]|nr:MAG: ATP-dependent helicase [Actinomycetales bacterium]
MLAAAVAKIAGEVRPGQQQMAKAISEAFEAEQHLLVQAGTGTGKSLGYLAPVMSLLADGQHRVVIATATLALQQQLAEKDIPNAIAALESAGGSAPKYSVLKGRSNYACLLKIRSGSPEQDALFGGAELLESSSSAAPESVLGAEVVGLRDWAQEQLKTNQLADRDDAPVHSAKAWAQVSVPVRECLGAAKCPFAGDCFVEKSREKARKSQLIITNHSLLAIDAMHGSTTLPEYDVAVIDEAHELAARITSADTKDLSYPALERLWRRAVEYLSDETALNFYDAIDGLRDGLDQADPGQITDSADPLMLTLSLLRDTSRTVISALSGGNDPDKAQVAAAVKEIFDISERMTNLASHDVLWVSESEAFGKVVYVAPIQIAGLMRDRVLADRTVVFTSATLALGGNFELVARTVGLGSEEDQSWQGIDVGSPFDYRRQGILYIAKDLPNPGRDGISAETLKQIADLVWAAGGRTLGLFASRRSAEQAAEYVRRELPKMTVLCQGDAQLSELTKRFTSQADSCLFGTISLWQGIDIPGDTCQLVIIDKIPFPRPDDPLMQARQRAVSENGGNGFMAVSAAHAALLLAQGTGRLIRRSEDRGVVAVLDPRLVKARYGSFLRSAMPDFWVTNDLETTIGSLKRLAEDRDD